MDRLLYSTTEAATRLNIGKTKLFELLRSGELESVLLGSARLVPADALHNLIARLRQTDGVARLLELIDDEGRIDLAKIPSDCTLADLEAARRIVAERSPSAA